MTIGIDVASVDENGNPGWSIAQSQGHLRYVGLRCAEGLTPDTSYPTYRRQLDALAIPNFPYLMITPGLATPEAQADCAIAACGVLNHRYFPLAIDVEGDRRGLTAEQWLAFVTAVKRRIKQVLGVAPLIYTSRTYWVDPVGMNNLPAPELAECLGWWKYWPFAVRTKAVYDPPTVDNLPPPAIPPPWGSQWGQQQYQGDAIAYPGFKSTVDMDRIHIVRPGDRNDTVKWIQHRFPALVVDGIYGPDTTTAVKSYQSKMNLEVDGITGLDTMSCLSWERI